MATDNIWQMLTDNVGTVVTVASAIAAVIGALASRAETRKQRQLRTEQLRQTTMDPGTRTLLKVVIVDELETDKVVNDPMGKDSSARYRFVMESASEADDVDV